MLRGGFQLPRPQPPPRGGLPWSAGSSVGIVPGVTQSRARWGVEMGDRMDLGAMMGHQPLGRKENIADLMSQRCHPLLPPPCFLLCSLRSCPLPFSSFCSALYSGQVDTRGHLPYWCLPQPPPRCRQTPRHMRLSQVQSQQGISLHTTDCILG